MEIKSYSDYSLGKAIFATLLIIFDLVLCFIIAGPLLIYGLLTYLHSQIIARGNESENYAVKNFNLSTTGSKSNFCKKFKGRNSKE